MTFDELRELAVKVEDGMETYWPQFSRSEKINLFALNPMMYRGRYSYNNSVVAFVDDNGDFYVIPDIGAQKVLIAAGYTREYFYVPFSNWDYPVNYKEKWEELWRRKNRRQ